MFCSHRSLAILAVLAIAGCESTPKRELALDLIEVEGAQLRTDTVGEGQFTDTATFVLVDARNKAAEGAYVTLAGELIDASGAAVGSLVPQSLWIPGQESRTFALVDSERKARPTTKSARAKVRGAIVLPPPLARIEELHSFDDHGQLVVQAYLVNDSNRDGQIMVIGSFHDAGGRPMTRPFDVVKIKAAQHPATPGRCPSSDSDKLPLVSKCSVQFIGPKGAVRGTMFVGETVY